MLRFLGSPERSHADHRELTAGGLDVTAPPPPPQVGPGPRPAGVGLTPPVGDVAADAHGLHEPCEHAVLLLRPLPALQGRVVLLVPLQALEGAAARLRGQSRQGLTGPPRGTAEGTPTEGPGPLKRALDISSSKCAHKRRLPEVTPKSPQAQIPKGGLCLARTAAKCPALQAGLWP